MKNFPKHSIVIFFTLIYTLSQAQTYTGSWIPLGPFGSTAGGTDYQGRIISFAENPANNDIIYFGGESGGLWKRDESGNSAELLNTDELERIGVAAIAVDPNSGTTSEDILIGTGSGYAIHYLDAFESDRRATSSGIYKTTDGGANWTQVLSWQSIMNPGAPGSVSDKENTVQIAKIIINRDDASKVLAAVRKPVGDGSNTNNWGRLYRSTDYGATWVEVSSSNISDKFFFDMEVSPGDANTVYLSSHRLYKSTDFGSTWTDVTSKLTGLNIDASSDKSFILIETAPVGSSSTYDNWVAVATNNESAGGGKELFVSTDGLATSINNKSMSSTIYIGRYNHSFEVGYNFNKIWFGGSSEKIYYANSLTEPITLTHYSSIHADIKALFVPEYSGSNQYTIFAGTDGGAYKSTTSSPSFSFINKDVSVVQFHSVASSETDNRIIGGTQDNASMVFRGNAWYWTSVGGDGSDCEIDPTNSNYMFYDDYLNPSFHASADAGVSAQSSSIVDAGGNIIVPIEISSFDNSLIYVGDDVLKVYEHDYETPTTSLPVGLTSLANYTHQNGTVNYVLAIGLSEQDPDKIYIATQGYYTELVGGTPCIVDRDNTWTGCETSVTWTDPTAYFSYNVFKSLDGGLTWTDISPATDLPGVTSEISSIAVNPNDDDEVWITYTGFERTVTGATLKNKNIFKTTNGGTTWVEDFDGSSNLPKCYTNKVVYQPNTNNRIFIATDKGVFWKEDGLNWQPFSNGLPNCPITDLSIDECEGNIYASSFGRGMWKSDLPINTFDDIHITTNTTWNTNDDIISNVVIEANAVLTITGATITMAGGKKFIVERGGRLEINNATITNACEALWEGIEVWGYDDLAHPVLTDVLSGAYPASEDDHGVVFINGNSIIENSHNGVSTSKYNEVGWSNPDYHGGIIVALASTFRNNRRSAEFLSYGYENVSEFIGCNFVTDDALFEGAIPFAHVSMWDVTGVLFMDNVFENTLPLATKKGWKRGKGIYSEEAAYDVLRSCITPLEPCGCEEWVGNTFDGLYRGIEARSIGVSFIYPLTIDGNTFNDNERAVLISSIGNIEMVNNYFQVPDFIGTVCYGLYLEGSTNYHVENNSFTTAGTVTEDSDPNSGMFVANSGTSGEAIYRNHFADMEIGIRCQNTNDGLQIRCNDFSTEMSKYNIVVSSGSIPHQGSCIIQPAKNIFTHDCGISHADFRLASGVSGFNYHYESGEDPICYSSSINLIECQDEYDCESGISDPCDEEEEEAQLMIESGVYLQELIDADYAKIDGGNTSALLEDIQEGKVTLEQLNEIGPYLSDEVLQALIETSEKLTTSDLLNVLSSNAPLSEIVTESLETAGITNELVIAEISEALIMTEEGPVTIYSPMQELLIEINYLENEKSMLIQKAVNTYLISKDTESAIAVLSSESSDWAKQRLITLYFSIEDYESAAASLSNLNSDDPNIVEFSELMSVLLNIKIEGRSYSDLTTEEESSLRKLNSKESTNGITAGNILRFAYSEDYPEVIDTIIDEVEFRTVNINGLTSKPKFKLYPNPASDIVYIELINVAANCDIEINVYDVTGRLVSNRKKGEGKSTTWLELTDLKSGIYLIEVICNKSLVGTESLVVE